ncbi:hypothetical protein [Actinomadura coerulea]|uniref:hypothetical protein n=1 Tax=Actinomadura coerulea TaxID=46159 RepID=UPI0034156575
METGILIRWGAPRPGRGKDALDLFQKSVEYYRGLVSDGKLGSFEPFMLGSGDSEIETGFFIIKGEVTQVFQLLDEQTHRDLMAQGSVLVEHYRFDMLAVGESIQRWLSDYKRGLTAVGV